MWIGSQRIEGISLPRQLRLDLGPQANNKVSMLLNRKEGEFFRKKGEGWVRPSSTRQKLFYSLNKERFERELEPDIAAAIERLNETLKTSSLEHFPLVDSALSQIFGKKGAMGRMSPRLFDRNKVKDDSPLIPHILDPHTIRVRIGSEVIFLKDRSVQRSFAITFELGSDEANHNLAMLFKQKSGDELQVVNNRLQRASLSDRISRIFNEKEEIRKIKEVVENTLRALGQSLPRIDESDERSDYAQALWAIFKSDGILGKMDYDRGVIQEGGSLERILYDQLDPLREAFFRAYREDPNHSSSWEEHLMRFMRCESHFARLLGLEMRTISSKGSGGARFAYDRHGHKILVVKPDDEGPHGTDRPGILAALKRFLFRKSELEGNSEAMSERRSYEVDRAMEFQIVPPTTTAVLTSSQFMGKKTKFCSLQAFIEGAQELGEYLGLCSHFHLLPRPLARWYLNRPANKARLEEMLPQNLVERISLHNFEIQDLDCHLDNILVKQHAEDEAFEIDERTFFFHKTNQRVLATLFAKERNGRGELISLIKHDGGASFPHSQPTTLLPRRVNTWIPHFSRPLVYKHFFEVLPHCAKPLSEGSLSFFSNQKLKRTEKTLRRTQKPLKRHSEAFIDRTPEILARWKEATTIARAFIKGKKTLRSLLRVRTQKCFKEQLSKIHAERASG